MARLLVIAVLLLIGWRLLVGRWPWQSKRSVQAGRLNSARRLLGVSGGASREEIQSAHRRLLASVHPDRGGSNAQVHQANEARDLLIAQLNPESKERA